VTVAFRRCAYIFVLTYLHTRVRCRPTCICTCRRVVVAKMCKNFQSILFFDSPVAFSSVEAICVFYLLYLLTYFICERALKDAIHPRWHLSSQLHGPLSQQVVIFLATEHRPSFAATRIYRLRTEARACEQHAQGRYATVKLPAESMIPHCRLGRRLRRLAAAEENP